MSHTKSHVAYPRNRSSRRGASEEWSHLCAVELGILGQDDRYLSRTASGSSARLEWTLGAQGAASERHCWDAASGCAEGSQSCRAGKSGECHSPTCERRSDELWCSRWEESARGRSTLCPGSRMGEGIELDPMLEDSEAEVRREAVKAMFAMNRAAGSTSFCRTS